jgi:hypothetical protein
MTFDPRDRLMNRDRGQVLFRYRPGQTFDHPGGYTAQVRQYGRDDAFAGPAVDREYLVAEAMHLVARWRSDGGAAPGAEPGSDRAPEFPQHGPLAHSHYDVVIPGRVFAAVWPRVIRCADGQCGLVFNANDPRPGADQWPPPCPRCGRVAGNRQLQFLFGHQCGEALPMRPPRACGRGHDSGFRLNDRASRFRDFRWECLVCRLPMPVQAFCPNPRCAWTNKMMQPLLHTASSSHAGQGVTVVNPPREEFARLMGRPGFVVATIARWLGLIDEEDAHRLASGDETAEPPPEIIAAIDALRAAGAHEQAEALRQRFTSAGLDDIRRQVTAVIGFDPLADELGRDLARQLSVYHRVLELHTIRIAELPPLAVTADRRALYACYPSALARAGLDAQETFLITDFPVTYLAVGYTRGGFGPTEADLVAYKGRAARGQQVTTLLYANPTETEALCFGLDRDRVTRWMAANGYASEAELADAGGPHRWFAGRLDPRHGQLPAWPDPPPRNHPDHPPYRLFGLLHTVAHQVLRALAVDSGYTETSLGEYLFPYDLAFAIHPNGGREFTIGALRTVLEQNLDQVIERAVDNDSCLYDPHCLLSNNGADHGCLLLPETACRSFNQNLSRWLLYGSPDGSVIGYWDPRLN